MKRAWLAVLVVLAAAAYLFEQQGGTPPPAPSPASDVPAGNVLQSALTRAVEERLSNVEVTAEAVVSKTLADDERGSRHQRFLIALPNGQTVLIAHNIDLADRVEGLRAGDRVSIRGEYEWNDRGGVIHWTHRDPRGTHPPGWIKHQGRTYQ